MTQPRWELGADYLSIVEQGSAPAAPEFVDSVDPDLWTQLRLSATRSAGEEDWQIAASQFVGVARLKAGTETLALQVVPKLAVDVFFLAEHAFGIREKNAVVDRWLRADLALIREDPTACLIAWFLADVDAFARRHLRRSYELHREVLEGGLRERLVLEDYVANHLAEGRPQEVPCEFPELTLDTPANRAIRATVQLAVARARMLGSEKARAILGQRARQILALLAGVADVRLTAATFPQLRWAPQLPHYRALLDRCEAFASGLYMERELGPHERQAFLWDMNALFEEGLRGIIHQWPGGEVEGSRPRATIYDPGGSRVRSSTVKPDIVLRTSGNARILLDAKYKDTQVEVEDEEGEFTVAGRRIRVSRGDIYQAVAYRAHDEYGGSVVGLVFPVALSTEEQLPDPYVVEGFGEPVHLLFVDVGMDAIANLPHFFKSLDDLADQSGTILAAAA